MKSVEELNEYIQGKNGPKNYKIAVGSLIFTPNDKVILIERGADANDAVGKLEGVGGGLGDNEIDLQQALLREIKEEIGKVDVKIKNLLTVMILPGENYPWWVVPVYLSRLVSGTPQIMEPKKITKIHFLGLDEINQDQLSLYQQETMKAYRNKYGSKPFYLS